MEVDDAAECYGMPTDDEICLSVRSANDEGGSTEEETAGGDNDDSDIDEPLPHQRQQRR